MTSTKDQGPWVDVHAHPGRCFLGGLPHDNRQASAMGGDGSDASLQAIFAAGMAAVSFSTVADLLVLGVRANGSLGARREFQPGEVYADHTRQLEAIAALAVRHHLAIVRTALDIERAHSNKQAALLVTCEGADFVEDQLHRVEEACEVGARSITIVHYRQNEFGDLQTEPALHGGLSPAGRALVKEMNRLGMIVDLAHASFETTMDTLATSTDPVMISHTHLSGEGREHPRLVSLQHAKAVAEAGGLIGAWPSGVTSETFDDFVDEVARLAEAIGVENVGIGTDMDANFKPVLTGYNEFALLEEALVNRGFNQGEVNRVLGGNAVELVRNVCG
jgi:membrane dipeptidase